MSVKVSEFEALDREANQNLLEIMDNILARWAKLLAKEHAATRPTPQRARRATRKISSKKK